MLLSLAPGLARAEHYKLFILTGEANALGMTLDGQPDPHPVSDPADAGVILFWQNQVDAGTPLGDSGNVFVPLQTQQGGLYAGSPTHWGPEIGFARSLYRAGVRDFGVIKVATGAGGNTDWSKADNGFMYSELVATVTTAINELLGNGDTFEIASLLYVQGESDSAAEAALAGARLGTLVSDLQSELPNSATMHTLIGGIAAAGASRDTVRSQQSALAAGDPEISYIDNLDLQAELVDALYLDQNGKQRLGERFSRALVDAGTCQPDFGKLVFMGDSITQGGFGAASYRYEVFKYLVDRSASYTFTGTVTGPFLYEDLSAITPDYGGQSFLNVHEGHWGWRVSWEVGRIALPASRRSGNQGEGTVETWTGQASEYEISTPLISVVPYPDPAATDTGNTGTTYIPDTVVLLVGFNDLLGNSTPPQVRDDLGVMIDHLRVANPEVRIHLNHITPTDQGEVVQARFAELNALLQPLADEKNMGAPSSPVWVIDAATGFNAETMTSDGVHPNLVGEEYLGERIAAGLGLTETPEPGPTTFGPPSVARSVSSFSDIHAGNEIFDGTDYLNGWSETVPAATTESLSGSILNRFHINGAMEWLEGTAATKDGGSATWASGNRGSWTVEVRLRFNANPNGLAIRLGTDVKAIIVEIHADRTRDDGGDQFEVLHDNLDGEFHSWRIAHDSGHGRYHVWRDGERLTALEGARYDLSINDGRFLIGDSIGGSFGDNYDVDIESIAYDQSGAYIPVTLLTDSDGDGMSDAFELLNFGDPTAADPNDDPDADGCNNLGEFLADTDPNDLESRFLISEVREESGMPRVTVAESSVLRRYSLYESDDLGIMDPWTLVVGPLPGNGGDLVLPDPEVLSGRGFYRVGVELP